MCTKLAHKYLMLGLLVGNCLPCVGVLLVVPKPCTSLVFIERVAAHQRVPSTCV